MAQAQHNRFETAIKYIAIYAFVFVSLGVVMHLAIPGFSFPRAIGLIGWALGKVPGLAWAAFGVLLVLLASLWLADRIRL